MRKLLAIRDARYFFAGQTLSLFGDTALFLALGIWVKTLTHSNAAAGLVFFCLGLPALIAPLGGLLVDRVRRRPLMILTDLAIGCLVLLLLLVHDASRVWLIYLVAFLYGTAGIVFFSAQSALLTVMLPDDLLGEGNAVLQTAREGLRLVAPLAGAGLFAAFGGGAVAAIDAATFGISAVCLSLLRVREPEPHHHEQHFLTELAAGARHVYRTLALRYIVLTAAVALLVIGFTETLIFAVVAQGLHRPPSFLGILESAQGVGAIGGGLTAGMALRRVGDVRLVALGLALFGIGDASMVSTSLPLIFGGIAVAGWGLPWAIVGLGTALQRRTPANLQGRVASAADTLIGTPQIVSVALGAALSTVVDYRILVTVVCVVVLACGIFLFTAPAHARLPASTGEPSDLAVAR